LAVRILLLTLLWVWSSVSMAEEIDLVERFGVQSGYDPNLEIPWLELETRVSAPPRDADLVELPMDKLPPNLKLYADLTNLLVDKRDMVTRTWLVVRSTQGAYNGTYEGIRCATKEYKIYAYANPSRSDKPLRVAKFPGWREIKADSYREELARDYLCADILPRSPDQIRATPVRSPGQSQYLYPY
jgi:hypothetical protein